MQAYLGSVYYVLVVASTYGFGDILPSNPVERLMSCFLMYGGQIAIAVLLASSEVVMQEVNCYQVEFQQQLEEILRFSQRNGLRPELSARSSRPVDQWFLCACAYRS